MFFIILFIFIDQIVIYNLLCTIVFYILIVIQTIANVYNLFCSL
jgi:hypothetical protein